VAIRRTSSAGSGRSPTKDRPDRRDPDPRALEAMAHAVSRSRGQPVGSPPAGGRRRAHGDQRERPLRIAVVIAGVALLLAGMVLAVSGTSRSNGGMGSTTAVPATHPRMRTRSAPSSATTTTQANQAGAGAEPTQPAPANAVAPGTTPTTVPPSSATSGAPAVTSLAPAAGGPGTSVTITGSGFLSADGMIVAEMDGQAAPTSCPDQTTCTVTVPTLPATPGPVPVTVTTSAGTSAPISFSYS
jgi:hypothetical protein